MVASWTSIFLRKINKDPLLDAWGGFLQAHQEVFRREKADYWLGIGDGKAFLPPLKPQRGFGKLHCGLMWVKQESP